MRKAKTTKRATAVISCFVASLGSTLKSVKLPAKAATVATVLALSRVAFTSEEVWVNGVKADLRDKMQDGDTAVLVTPKSAGSR